MTCENCCDPAGYGGPTKKSLLSNPMARLWLFLSLITISVLLVSCHITSWQASTSVVNLNKNEVQEFLEFQQWRKFKNSLENSKTAASPPSPTNPALMARFVVNQADWSAIATVSSRREIFSYPYTSVVSISDGPLGNGIGIPYMTLSPLSATAKNLKRDSRATMMMTLAEGNFCQERGMDPQDPRCARIDLTGRIVKISADDPDYDTAKNAVYGRHPWLANMPADHHFFFAKLEIQSIAVLDAFGGAKYLTLTEYLHPTPELSKEHEFDVNFASTHSNIIYKS